MSEYKRPKFLSIMIGVEMIRFMTNFIYTLVISFTNTNILSISLIFNFLVWVVSLSGMWMMKRWSVIIYITMQIYFVYNAIMAGGYNITDYLIFIFPAILIYLGFKNYKYMN
jgi:hypothetical protein